MASARDRGHRRDLPRRHAPTRTQRLPHHTRLRHSNLPATFGYVAHELGKRKIAFLCARESVKEPRLGLELKRAFGGVYIANEGFTPESAEEALGAGEADAVAFGKLFLANPDLPRRIALKSPLNPWNSATFYSQGDEGYTDYPPLAEAAE